MIDEVRIFVKGGNGGKGCVSFHRTKFNPHGTPDGGNGGNGGSVILHASLDRSSFLDFKAKPHYKAENGKNGGSNNKNGANGADLVLLVPVGTIVKDVQANETLGDLTLPGQEIKIASGGRGGRGNASFVTQKNRYPKFALPGSNGEEKVFNLELRLLADVGLIGKPNSGKSTLLNRITSANSRVGDYAFTTLDPVLGAYRCPGNDRHIIFADIPGLIEGASKGKGLGHKFLRHIKRTCLLTILLDISKGVSSAKDDLDVLLEELRFYDHDVFSKRKTLLLNKIDLVEDKKEIKRAIEFFTEYSDEPVFACSALNGDGVDIFLEHVFRVLKHDEKVG
ncbi:MAG: Obg family GTPase CgtA [Actinobacteria bacterium]|nr:Obg family GTPase CgtA [Actinomycetota bacterium]